MTKVDDSRGPIAFATGAEVRDVALDVVRQSRRYLEIVSRNLEPIVYDTREFVSAVKSMVTKNPKAEVRIIVLRPDTLQGVHHHLIDLAQRLNSFISVRRPSADYWEFNEAMIIGDRRHVLHRRISDRFEGAAYFNAEGRAAKLLQVFNEVWEYGEPDPNFRQLIL
jgi:hypothetical protein